MFRIGLGVGRPLPSFGDSDAQAFLSAAGITGATETAAVNTLVTSLKGYGIWSKMKAVYPFVTDNRNLLSYTEDFSNGYWAKTNNTITINSITAPNGTTTADTFTDNTTNGQHKVQTADITSVIGAGNTFVASAYFKANTATRAAIYAYGTSVGVGVDLTNGNQITVNGINNASASNVTITNVGNGWYKVTMNGVVSGVFSIAFMMISGNDFSYAGAGNSLYAWGAQLELGSTATTYQPIATTQQSYISSQFKYNLVNPVDSDAAFRLVFNGGWTHSSTGATPNGTNGYADTKLVPSSVLAQNSASIGAYLRTNNTGDYCDMGSSNMPTYNSGLYLFYNVVSNKDYSRNNNDSGSGGTTTASSGFIVNKRTTSTDMKVIINNGLTLSNGNATTGRSTSPILISAMNRGGTIELYSNRQTAFNFVSDGLTDTEAANLYTAVQAFQNSLNRAIAP